MVNTNNCSNREIPNWRKNWQRVPGRIIQLRVSMTPNILAARDAPGIRSQWTLTRLESFSRQVRGELKLVTLAGERVD